MPYFRRANMWTRGRPWEKHCILSFSTDGRDTMHCLLACSLHTTACDWWLKHSTQVSAKLFPDNFLIVVVIMQGSVLVCTSSIILSSLINPWTLSYSVLLVMSALNIVASLCDTSRVGQGEMCEVTCKVKSAVESLSWLCVCYFPISLNK